MLRPSFLLCLSSRSLSRCSSREYHRSSQALPALIRPTHRCRQIHHFTKPELKEILPSMEDLGLMRGDHVTVAMSGGVDSSVALRILSEMPLDLNVIYMRNWDPLLSESPPDHDTASSSSSLQTLSYPSASSSRSTQHQCSWERDWRDVQAVCAHVGIPPDRVKLVDLSKEYWSKVFEPSVKVWEAGGTPNPDVLCNSEIKFGELLKHIPNRRRAFLATGHYARVKRVPHAIRLCRATDMAKDQTYYLSGISEASLRRAIFPLADITKSWVRRLAEYYNLPTAERDESMGVCFIGERDNFGDFVSQYTSQPAAPGYLVDESGNRLCEHKGMWYYTIGQGARLANKLEKWYIAKKGVGESGQDILVVPGAENPKLLCTQVTTEPFHWIHNKLPNGIVPGGTKRAYVQVRHRMEPATAVISHEWYGQGLQVEFPDPILAVAPGQTLTIWYQKWCLGSGIIKETKTLDEFKPRSWRAIKQGRTDEELAAMDAQREGQTVIEEVDEEMQDEAEGEETGGEEGVAVEADGVAEETAGQDDVAVEAEGEATSAATVEGFTQADFDEFGQGSTAATYRETPPHRQTGVEPVIESAGEFKTPHDQKREPYQIKYALEEKAKGALAPASWDELAQKTHVDLEDVREAFGGDEVPVGRGGVRGTGPRFRPRREEPIVDGSGRTLVFVGKDKTPFQRMARAAKDAGRADWAHGRGRETKSGWGARGGESRGVGTGRGPGSGVGEREGSSGPNDFYRPLDSGRQSREQVGFGRRDAGSPRQGVSPRRIGFGLKA